MQHLRVHPETRIVSETILHALVFWLPAFLFSVTVHEAAHAWAALRLGDPTAWLAGQVSLSPWPHLRRSPIGMGVVPLTFMNGASWSSLGLTGEETVVIHGLGAGLAPRQTLNAQIRFSDGSSATIPLLLRIDTLDELEYFKNGGILPYVLRQLAP